MSYFLMKFTPTQSALAEKNFDKPHDCECCKKKIPSGGRKVFVSEPKTTRGDWSGNFMVRIICPDCADIHGKFMQKHKKAKAKK